MDWKYAVTSVALAVFLTACGGGGGGGSEAPKIEQPAPTVSQFVVSASAGAGGTISPTNASINSGESLELNITPDQHYKIDQVSGCNGSLTELTYTTGPVTENCEVTVTFIAIDPDTVPPSVSVLFPGPKSLTGATSLTITGTASDDKSVAAVRVNGLKAILTRPSKFSPAAGTTDGDHVDWSLSIPLQINEFMTLDIEVEDEYGNIATPTDPTIIHSDQKKIPINFEVDQVNRKLFGMADSDKFVSWGLDDSSYTESTVFNNNTCYATALKTDTNEFICVSNLNHQIKISGKSVVTNAERIIADTEYQINQQDWPYISVSDAQVSSDNSTLYILLRLNPAQGDWYSMRSSILAFKFSDNSLTTVVDGTTDSPDIFGSFKFSVIDDGFLVFTGNFNQDGLKKYSLDGTSVTSISDPTNFIGQKITADKQNKYAYITGIDGVAKIDLDTSESIALSAQAKDEEFAATQVYSSSLDESANRLIVGDSGYDYIYTVDINSGERSELIARSIGTGKHTYWPSALALHEASNILYTIDEGGNSGETLLAIDLQTGNRTTLAHLGLDCRRGIVDLIPDLENQQLIAVFSHAVFALSTVDGQLTPLAGATDNACSQTSFYFAGASIDKTNNRLLVSEPSSNSILALDLATRTLSTLFSSPDIGGATDIEYDELTGKLLIGSKALAKIIQLDLETEQLSTLVDVCPMSDGRNAFEEDYRGIEYMHLDSKNRALWVMADALARYDLDSNTCKTMPFKGNGYAAPSHYDLRDVAITTTGKLYGATYQNVAQINFETGDMVTISR